MQEHPVPQDITGYQFHIVGNMTIKQFAEIGAGALLGFIIYTTNLPDFLKWPLVFTAVALGAGAAFVPIEERPLDHWIMQFFKVMYRPTKYFWKREPKIPDPFLFEPNRKTELQPIEVDLSPARRERIKEFMSSLRNEEQIDPYQAYQDQRVSSVLDTFSQVTAQEVDVIRHIEKPSLTVRVRDLKAPEAQERATGQAVAPDHETTPERAAVTTDTIAENITVPKVETVKVTKPALEEDGGVRHTQQHSQSVYVSNQASEQTIDTSATQQTSFNQDLPFPSIPQEPNKPVGMVIGPNNEILNNSIVEIRTLEGQVARAVKTNSLGQFFITTPLKEGEYIIETEHEGYQFPQIQLSITGSALPPIEVRAQ